MLYLLFDGWNWYKVVQDLQGALPNREGDRFKAAQRMGRGKRRAFGGDRFRVAFQGSLTARQ
jgi:hypothetical protein